MSAILFTGLLVTFWNHLLSTEVCGKEWHINYTQIGIWLMHSTHFESVISFYLYGNLWDRAKHDLFTISMALCPSPTSEEENKSVAWVNTKTNWSWKAAVQGPGLQPLSSLLRTHFLHGSLRRLNKTGYLHMFSWTHFHCPLFSNHPLHSQV